MMSHHVTCHVTAMSHASSSSIKRKRKRKQNIKSRKINKRKRKMLVSKVFHNIATLELFHNEIVTGFQLESNGNADYFCKSYIVGKFT